MGARFNGTYWVIYLEDNCYSEICSYSWLFWWDLTLCHEAISAICPHPNRHTLDTHTSRNKNTRDLNNNNNNINHIIQNNAPENVFRKSLNGSSSVCSLQAVFGCPRQNIFNFLEQAWGLAHTAPLHRSTMLFCCCSVFLRLFWSSCASDISLCGT